VVGGYAVAFHGYPRFTKDMDIWIEINEQNAQNMIKALDQFGFASLGLKAQDFLVPDQIIQLGYPPNRINVITTLSGVNFSECYSKRVEVDIEGLLINFINLNDLIANKRATGRYQDLADLENLK
jgi:hypothetical protein